jgi:hypothetical protein
MQERLYKCVCARALACVSTRQLRSRMCVRMRACVCARSERVCV